MVSASVANPTSSLAFLLAVVLVAGCSKDPVRPFPSPPTVLYPTFDRFPVWSRDGSSVAYLRLIPSADGPPGIYLISKWGGAPRLVTPGFFFRPQFSPDDRRLVALSENAQVTTGRVSLGIQGMEHTLDAMRFGDLRPTQHSDFGGRLELNYGVGACTWAARRRWIVAALPS